MHDGRELGTFDLIGEPCGGTFRLETEPDLGVSPSTLRAIRAAREFSEAVFNADLVQQSEGELPITVTELAAGMAMADFAEEADHA